MPFYEIHHSYPLTSEQRQSLATSITNLHCTAFTTPSFFVHVKFIAHDASDGTYFLAGKPHPANSNRIVAIVRTSPARNRADFDDLGAKIEGAWNDLLKPTESVDYEARRLLLVTFVPMVTIREAGMAIPEAGHEGAWMKEQLPYFREMSKRGVEDFTNMLEELDQRDDLKKLLQ